MSSSTYNLQQSSAFGPFMGQFIALAPIARRAGKHDIAHIVRAASCDGNNVFNMVLSQLVVAVVALTLLTFELLSNILSGVISRCVQYQSTSFMSFDNIPLTMLLILCLVVGFDTGIVLGFVALQAPLSQALNILFAMGRVISSLPFYQMFAMSGMIVLPPLAILLTMVGIIASRVRQDMLPVNLSPLSRMFIDSLFIARSIPGSISTRTFLAFRVKAIYSVSVLMKVLWCSRIGFIASWTHFMSKLGVDTWLLAFMFLASANLAPSIEAIMCSFATRKIVRSCWLCFLALWTPFVPVWDCFVSGQGMFLAIGYQVTFLALVVQAVVLSGMNFEMFGRSRFVLATRRAELERNRISHSRNRLSFRMSCFFLHRQAGQDSPRSSLAKARRCTLVYHSLAV